jgi:Ca2+-binding EF-hand superfamily protein
MKLTIALTLLSAVICMAEPNATTDKLYSELDANKDGELTSKEFANEIIAISFLVFDTDRDDLIDAEEWSAKEKGAEAKAAFDALDSDKDGTIAFSEYNKNPLARAELVKIFLTLDPNRYGTLTTEEIPANKKP